MLYGRTTVLSQPHTVQYMTPIRQDLCRYEAIYDDMTRYMMLQRRYDAIYDDMMRYMMLRHDFAS